MGIIDTVVIGGIVLLVLIAVTGMTAAAYLLGKLIGGRGEKGARFLCIFISYVNVLIAAVGFVCNFGWNRTVMSIILVPLWYPFLLLFASASVPTVIRWSKEIRVSYIVSNVCFLLSGLLFPDGLENAGGYAFFGLFRDPPDYLVGLSIALFVLSIAAMIHQLVAVRRTKRKLGLM